MNEVNFKSLDITKKITPPKTIKILIVEDDPIQRCVIKSSLENSGIFDITLAASAEEAVKLFSENFDLIITDFNLPDMNGIEVTRRYRRFSKNDTPVICCSSDIEKIRRLCIEAGIDDFLSKPINQENLREMLECWIPTYRVQKNIA